MAGPVGIYISIPFCKAKCTFCNFASGVFGVERMERYVERLCGEIRRSHAAAERLRAALPREVDTIYFGGGTPSLLSGRQFQQIFHTLRGEFDVVSNAEITLECAPGQLSSETLEELKRQRMNRVSFGVQSFMDRETAAVGRLHTERECEAEFARVRAAGIDEINIDLIAGLPHQTAESWKYSVEAAIANAAPHISVYMLEVDDESRLGREMMEQGTRYSASSVPSEDESAEWYQQACAALNAAGVEQYEISNFARAGHRSRHNLKYWQRAPYRGFGLDAHSMLLADDKAVRFANTSDLEEYLDERVGDAENNAPFRMLEATKETAGAEVDVIGRDEAFEESLFLGLRLNEGIDLNRLRGQFGDAMLQDALPALLEVRDAGLLELNSDSMRLTANGRMVSNEVFSRLLIASAA